MFGYELNLAVHGLRRFPKSTALVVVTVALGIAACMTTLTLLHVLSADPLPNRSQHLYLAWVGTVLARPFKLEGCPAGVTCGVTFNRLKLPDAEALVSAHRAKNQAIVAPLTADESSDDGSHAENQQSILATSSDFMPMMGVRLRYGRDWTPAEDRAGAPVAVIDVQLARKLFGTADAVGRSVRLDKASFRVIGVMQRFAPEPHFYALDEGTYNKWENMYVPYAAAFNAGLQPADSDRCDASYHPPGGAMGIGVDPAHCASVALWVQLDTPQQVAGYRTLLQNYVDQQAKALSSFGKPAKYQLTAVSDWLQRNHVVPASTRLNVWLAASFLVLCMLNVTGLLSARFLHRSSEIGIRRALGAPRRSVFVRHLAESAMVCLIGGMLAIPLTLLGLWIMNQQNNDFAGLVRFDPTMFVALVTMSVVIGALVGLLPAWRAAVIEPGLQVKSE